MEKMVTMKNDTPIDIINILFLSYRFLRVQTLFTVLVETVAQAIWRLWKSIYQVDLLRTKIRYLH